MLSVGVVRCAAVATSGGWPPALVRVRVHSSGLYRERYNGITQMHRELVVKWHAVVRPPAPAPHCCKYSCCCWLFLARPSTRRRDAVCSPFQRTPLTRIFCKKIYSRCQRTRSFTTFIMTFSQKTILTRSYNPTLFTDTYIQSTPGGMFNMNHKILHNSAFKRIFSTFITITLIAYMSSYKHQFSSFVINMFLL